MNGVRIGRIGSGNERRGENEKEERGKWEKGREKLN